MKSVQIALLLALLLPIATLADAKPNKSSSFKSGFSSQSSSSTRSGSSFGSFGSSRSTTPPRAPDPSKARSSGGFGSFGGGGAAPAPQQSDSALSQRLNKKASEDNALRTLEARRRAEQDAINANARPVPSGPLPAGDPWASRKSDPNNGYTNSRLPMPQPVVIQQGSNGIANMVTGFLLGKVSSPARSSTAAYPATAAGSKASGGGFFTAMLRTLAWLVILAIVGWTVYFVWKFLRRGKAPSTANYSFER